MINKIRKFFTPKLKVGDVVETSYMLPFSRKRIISTYRILKISSILGIHTLKLKDIHTQEIQYVVGESCVTLKSRGIPVGSKVIANFITAWNTAPIELFGPGRCSVTPEFKKISGTIVWPREWHRMRGNWLYSIPSPSYTIKAEDGTNYAIFEQDIIEKCIPIKLK